MAHAISWRTQDLIFTLYGDYLLQRDSPIWIGSLIEMLGALDVSDQAVRSTTSRMARKGWLSTTRIGRNSYYALTCKAIDLLSKGAQQIYFPKTDDWDGSWYLLTYSFSDEQQQTRHQLRRHLSWLGFGQLASGTWLAPHDRRDDLCAILDELDIASYVDYFRAEHICFGEARSLAQRCWDLDALNQRYHRFLDAFNSAYRRDRCALNDGDAQPLEYYFRQRFWLVHEYRYFPFHDPCLPAELLPASWLGHTAIELFKEYHALLRSKANAYVSDVLDRAPLAVEVAA
jgi:phenylacetic acid degradation operon negative regulatory protein